MLMRRRRRLHQTVPDDPAVVEECWPPRPFINQEPEHDEAEGRAPTPSWADYFHELRGTLGIGGPTKATLEDMVLLANFDQSAAELPVSGELAATF